MRLPAGDLPELGAVVVASATDVATAESALLGLAATTVRAGSASAIQAAAAALALEECRGSATTTRIDLVLLAGLLGVGDAALHAVDAVLAAHFVGAARTSSGGLLALPGRVLRDDILLARAAATIELREVASVLPPVLIAGALSPFRLLDDGPGYAHATADVLPGGGSGAPDLAGWLARVDDVPIGHIAVTSLGGNRWVVQLPGLHSILPVADPQDLPDAAQALVAGRSAYERSVVQALALSCVPPGAELLLVGHSQGGIVAADLARDPAVTSRWRVTHVVTAGSPVSRIPVPPMTRLLEIDNDDDLVPDLDGARSRDGDGGDRTVLRFHAEHGSVGADHSLARSYEPYLRGAGAADPRAQAWVSSAAGYLGDGPASTTVFALSDAPPATP